MRELSEEHSIIIVTDNMQQAARVSIFTAFLMADDTRIGHLVEYGESRQILPTLKTSGQRPTSPGHQHSGAGHISGNGQAGVPPVAPWLAHAGSSG